MSETTPEPATSRFKDAQVELREAKRVLDRAVKLLDAAAAGRLLEASSILNRAPDLFRRSNERVRKTIHSERTDQNSWKSNQGRPGSWCPPEYAKP